ncbi:hypothetical protein ACQUSY_02505 [Microbacterium sp. YY-03]|uniref:hypothetical protein n=1 Tax=Microbacterium sp. YY-03 TaxID=3421636 RepID=UPI003D175132
MYTVPLAKLNGRATGSVSIGEHKREQLGEIRDHVSAVLQVADQIGALLSSTAMPVPNAVPVTAN